MLIQILIIEDETQAVEKLERLLKQMDDKIEILDVIGTVSDAVDWLKTRTCDLLFLDINLGDGNSFDIFEQVLVQTPIIFTTAYDEFAIQAFEQNSVAYLLKPFGKEDIQRAIKKYKTLYHRPEKPANTLNYEDLISALRQDNNRWKKNFLLQVGSKLKKIAIEDVQYFYAHEKSTFLVTDHGRTYPIDETLSELENDIDPQQFFRLNRKFLICRKSIKEVYYLSAARIKLELHPKPSFETLVPIEKIGKFKKWLAD